VLFRSLSLSPPPSSPCSIPLVLSAQATPLLRIKSNAGAAMPHRATTPSMASFICGPAASSTNGPAQATPPCPTSTKPNCSNPIPPPSFAPSIDCPASCSPCLGNPNAPTSAPKEQTAAPTGFLTAASVAGRSSADQRHSTPRPRWTVQAPPLHQRPSSKSSPASHAE